MTGRVAEIWRHPVKGIGRERLREATLRQGAPLPGDRAWAIVHEGGADTDAWQKRRNYLQAASGPALMAVHVATEDTLLTFTHPDRPPLTVDPERDGASLIDWARPLWPEGRPAPVRVVTAPPQGFADNGIASLALLNRASGDALADAAGAAIDLRRFRGNIVLDGLEPWEEWSWVGREISIGQVRLEVVERIGRCRATEANPETGARDLDPLATLRHVWGHQDFGVYAVVTAGGHLAEGAELVA